MPCRSKGCGDTCTPAPAASCPGAPASCSSTVILHRKERLSAACDEDWSKLGEVYVKSSPGGPSPPPPPPPPRVAKSVNSKVFNCSGLAESRWLALRKLTLDSRVAITRNTEGRALAHCIPCASAAIGRSSGQLGERGGLACSKLLACCLPTPRRAPAPRAPRGV